jgi:hypothetical protein
VNLILCPTAEPCVPDWVIFLDNYQFHILIVMLIVFVVIWWLWPVRKREFIYIGDEYLENLQHQGD